MSAVRPTLREQPLFLLAEELLSTTQALFRRMSYDDWLKAVRARGGRNWIAEAERLVAPHRRSSRGRRVGEINLALDNVVESIRRLRAFVPIRTPAVRRVDEIDDVVFLSDEPVGDAENGWAVRFAVIRAELNGAFDSLAKLIGAVPDDLLDDEDPHDPANWPQVRISILTIPTIKRPLPSTWAEVRRRLPDKPLPHLSTVNRQGNWLVENEYLEKKKTISITPGGRAALSRLSPSDVR